MLAALVLADQIKNSTSLRDMVLSNTIVALNQEGAETSDSQYVCPLSS